MRHVYATTQKTSKAIKLQLLVSFVTAAVGGLVVVFTGLDSSLSDKDRQTFLQTGWAMLLGGGAWFLTMRLYRWWQHD